MRMNLNPINNNRIGFQAGGIFKSNNDSEQISGKTMPIQSESFYKSCDESDSYSLGAARHELKHLLAGAYSGDYSQKIQLNNDGSADSSHFELSEQHSFYDELAYSLSRMVVAIAPSVRLPKEANFVPASIPDIEAFNETSIKAAKKLVRCSIDSGYYPDTTESYKLLTQKYAETLRQRAIKSASAMISSVPPFKIQELAEKIVNAPNKRILGGDLLKDLQSYNLTETPKLDDDLVQDIPIDLKDFNGINESIKSRHQYSLKYINNSDIQDF